MQMDALTVAALADELRAALGGARIEDVAQPTPAAVALHCWGDGRSRWLLISAHAQLARAQLMDVKPRKLIAEPPAFVMLLRKHLEGARIVAVRQPRWERVLEIGCARGGAGAEPAVWLVAELMGRLSNIIARDADGLILGGLRLVGAEVNRYRTVAPHVPYRYPPPQTRLVAGVPVPRLDGACVHAAELRTAADAALAGASTAASDAPTQHTTLPATVAGLLATTLLGFSREMGREVAARALGQADSVVAVGLPWEDIAAHARALARLTDTHAWQPTLVYPAPEENAPQAYAVYEPRQYAGSVTRPAASVNAMLVTYYRGAEWIAAVEGAKGDLRHLLRTQHERTVRKDAALRTELDALGEAQRLREEADLLLAFQRTLAPHQERVTLENPFAAAADGVAPRVTIALDPRLSIIENANRRYARYHKLQRAAAAIPPQIAANDIERARIAQLQTDLALAESALEIAQVRAEVGEAGYLARQGTRAGRDAHARRLVSPKAARRDGKGMRHGKLAQAPRRADNGAPSRRVTSDGLTLVLGKNSRQNEEVTFHQASASDLWLHARGVPGAHVIVKCAGRTVPAATLREAAALAAYYSQARGADTVAVDYTEQRYVRHMQGGGPGMVTYERERTLYAAPADAALG